MKDWDWSTVFAFIFCIIVFSFAWFCVGFLAGGIHMAQWIEAHP